MPIRWGYSIKRFPADWDKFKKAAGYIRNEQMGNYCDIAIIFWDGSSKGTLNMITCKERAGVDGIVTHNALEDAWDVVQLLRKKY